MQINLMITGRGTERVTARNGLTVEQLIRQQGLDPSKYTATVNRQTVEGSQVLEDSDYVVLATNVKGG